MINKRIKGLPHQESPPPLSPVLNMYGSVNWVSIGSGHGLSPVRRQAITWTNADLLSNGPIVTDFSEIELKINKKIHSWKCIRQCHVQNGGHFAQGGGGGGGLR